MGTSRKDEILSRLVAIEEENSKLHTRREETKDAHANTRVQIEETTKVYNELARKLNEERERLQQLASDIASIDRIGSANADELAKLKRELDRISDAEKIDADYALKVDAFKAQCLTAPWRAENRSDGFGAKPYQLDGAIHLAVAGQAILGDKRGLGKTLTSLIYMDLVDARRVIAVVPPDMMQNFVREIHMWTPHRSPVVIGKQPKGVRDILLKTLKSQPEFFVLVNYEAWRKDNQLVDDLVALQADTLVMDEAHRMKEWDTRTCTGVRNIRFGMNMCPVGRETDTPCDGEPILIDEKLKMAGCKKCGHVGTPLEFSSIKHILPMTGTPILNSPEEIFPLLHLIDPIRFAKLSTFLQDFCYKVGQRYVWRHGGEATLMKIIGPRFLARDRNTAGVDIPEAQHITHDISLADLKEDYPKQYEAYLQVRDYAQLMLDPDGDTVMSMTVFLTVMLRLRQVLTWPAAIELKVKEQIGEDDAGEPILEEKVLANLDVYESAKVDRAEELIRELVKEGERVVVFSQFKGPLHELERRIGSRAAVYDGSTTQFRRQQIQLDFDPKTVSQNPKWDVVLCNYKAAGEGLNLNAASHMIIVDEEWNPGRQSQAYGRVDRLGTTKAAQIHTIRVNNSVDTWIKSLIDQKADMIAGFEASADTYRAAFEAMRNGEL